MANLTYLAQRLYNRPLWATQTLADTVQSVLAHRMKMSPILAVGAKLDSGAELPEFTSPKEPMLMDGVLTIPILGGLAHRGDALDAECGMQSYTNLQNMLVMSVKDPAVKGVLLDIDSGGGEEAGCLDFADTIMELRKEKPIWGIANGMACSAAYAILASCTRAAMTQTGDVGSIGVVGIHADHSKMLEKEGVAISFIYAGEHKIDGNSAQPLSDAARANWQANIDESYERFVTAVAARRPMSADQVKATKAKVFGSKTALELGLVDAVSSFEATRRELSSSVKSGTPGGVRMINGEPVIWQ